MNCSKTACVTQADVITTPMCVILTLRTNVAVQDVLIAAAIAPISETNPRISALFSMMRTASGKSRALITPPSASHRG
jgi:hypothetical protein